MSDDLADLSHEFAKDEFARRAVRLERFKHNVTIGITDALLKEFATSPKVSVDENPVLRHTVFQVVQGIAGERLQRTTVCYPRDWKEALKERFFPAWALRRWPVQYVQKVIDVIVLYPKIALPHKEHWLEIMQHTSEGTAEELDEEKV